MRFFRNNFSKSHLSSVTKNIMEQWSIFIQFNTFILVDISSYSHRPVPGTSIAYFPKGRTLRNLEICSIFNCNWCLHIGLNSTPNTSSFQYFQLSFSCIYYSMRGSCHSATLFAFTILFFSESFSNGNPFE